MKPRQATTSATHQPSGPSSSCYCTAVLRPCRLVPGCRAAPAAPQAQRLNPQSSAWHAVSQPRPLHGSSHSIWECRPKIADEHSALKLYRDGGSARTSACSTCRPLRPARATWLNPLQPHPTPLRPRPTLGNQPIRQELSHTALPAAQPAIGRSPTIALQYMGRPTRVKSTEASQPHHPNPAHPRAP